MSERANGRASGPVLTSLFLFVPDRSAMSGFACHSYAKAAQSLEGFTAMSPANGGIEARDP